MSATATAAAPTAFNHTTNLDNYYIVLDSIICSNSGGGSPTVALHKGLVLYSVTSGINDQGENVNLGQAAFGAGSAAINLNGATANLNYPNQPGTFWFDNSTLGSPDISRLKWQTLLIKDIQFDAALSQYKVYLTGYRKSMTMYDTVVPDASTTLIFHQPKLNGFSPNFVENFHWMADKWNNDPSSPWDPSNYNAPYASMIGVAPGVAGTTSGPHFSHGWDFNIQIKMLDFLTLLVIH